MTTFEGTFDPTTHLCFDKSGVWVPSVTQVLSAQGLIPDYRRYVAEDILSRRCKTGTEVHWLTDVFDDMGEVDSAWLNESVKGYYESWLGFRALSGFVPRAWSIRRFSVINGYKVTGETDKEGLLAGEETIIDLKTGTSTPTHWSYQTALYEMQKHGAAKVGRITRAVCRLYESGKAGKLLYHEDHAEDMQQALSALCNCTKRIQLGYLKPEHFT